MSNRRPSVGRLVQTVLAVLVSLAFLLPVIWLLASTFRSANETFATSTSISWHTLWPLATVLISTLCLTPTMTYVLLPFVTRVLQPWLKR